MRNWKNRNFKETTIVWNGNKLIEYELDTRIHKNEENDNKYKVI